MLKHGTAVRFLLLCLTLACVLGCLASCSENRNRWPEEEVREALRDLLPKAAELNVIYFGEGLPTSRDENAVRAFYESFDMDVKSISYTPVDPACGYENVDDIKAATLEVFTGTYAEILFDRAFTGISDVFDEGTDEEHRVTAVYAMYLEQDGYLTKRVNLADDALPLGREYDLSSMKILRANDSGVEVRLASTLNGAPSVDVELWLVKTENGWRLDSPTY